MQFSVLIIVKGRAGHLRNVLAGITVSSLRPAEVIVVHMNEEPYDLATALPVRQLVLRDKHPLPLARARNQAAQAATTDNLIFLDVDCVPATDCFETLLHDLPQAGLVMANPRYLTTALSDINFTKLLAQSQLNSARKNLQFGITDNYEMFWSLGFAITASDFARVGGFDETFVGYGGEDTDFAFSARQGGLTLCMSQAVVFHQPHASYDPPLNWLQDIVTNANAFKQKWQVWPMQGWLRQFADLGYISFSDTELQLLKLPAGQALAAVRKPAG